MKLTKRAILYNGAMVAFTLSGCANNAYTQTTTHTHKTSSQTTGATVKQAQVDTALAKKWRVVQFANYSETTLAKHDAALDFSELPLVGMYAGCNHISFRADTTTDNGLTMTDGVTTFMRCEGNLEDDMSAAVAKVARYQFVQGQLHLLDDANNTVMVLAE